MKKIFRFISAFFVLIPVFFSCEASSRPESGMTEIRTAKGAVQAPTDDAAADDSEEQTVYDVYLLIGQSNMAGRGTLLLSDMNEEPENVYLLGAENVPVQATHPFNQYSTIRKSLSMQQMGPGYSFSLKVLEAHPDRKILLVCNARGGTSITEWAKGSTYYSEAVRRTREALKYGELKAILWHQGCADS